MPASVVIHNTPQDTREVIKYDLGIYVQDSLRWNRPTAILQGRLFALGLQLNF